MFTQKIYQKSLNIIQFQLNVRFMRLTKFNSLNTDNKQHQCAFLYCITLVVNWLRFFFCFSPLSSSINFLLAVLRLFVSRLVHVFVTCKQITNDRFFFAFWQCFYWFTAIKSQKTDLKFCAKFSPFRRQRKYTICVQCVLPTNATALLLRFCLFVCLYCCVSLYSLMPFLSILRVEEFSL